MSALCPVCSTSDDSVEFPTVRQLVEHQQGGHRSRPAKVLKPSRPVRPSLTELAQAKGEDAVRVIKSEHGEVIEKPKGANIVIIKPLELQYKWVGMHKTCNMEVKTITVDLGEKAMIIAYCVNCDEKLEQREVVPIERQRMNRLFEDPPAMIPLEKKQAVGTAKKR